MASAELEDPIPLGLAKIKWKIKGKKLGYDYTSVLGYMLEIAMDLSLVFLLISNLTSWLRLHQFLGTKTTEANKSLKTDANGAN